MNHQRENSEGKLITLEGIDGAGKSTAMSELQSEYSDRDDIVFTKEPTDTWYGDAVYKSLSDDNVNEFAELFLYTADHANHLNNVIKPAVKSGKTVISDRYIDSRFAYQAASIGNGMSDPLNYIIMIHRPFTLFPDETLFFDVEPSVAVDRSAKGNKFEQLSYLKTVNRHYGRLSEMYADRYHKIDASLEKDVVLDTFVEYIDDQI